MNALYPNAPTALQPIHDLLLSVMATVKPAGPDQWTAMWKDATLPPLHALSSDGFLQLSMNRTAGLRPAAATSEVAAWEFQGAPCDRTRCGSKSRAPGAGRGLQPASGHADSWPTCGPNVMSDLSKEWPSNAVPSLWDLVRANVGLSSLAKYALTPAGTVSLQAEIPIGAETELAVRLTETCDALARAFNQAQPRNAIAAGSASSPAPDVAQLCEAAGWACSSRKDGRCVVPLETRRAAYTALVMAEHGRVRVSTELADWESLTPTVREALAVYLLSANALLRLVRTAVTEDDAGGAAQLEVLFETPPSSEELRCAFEALSIGADLCGPEAVVLQHEAAAQLFLTVRGGPRPTINNQPIIERHT